MEAMEDISIPDMINDDTPVKRRGISAFIEETPLLHLYAQAGDIGKPNIGPLENLDSELYSFFAIEGAPSDPGRRILLAHAYEAYAGLRPTFPEP